MAKKNQRKKTVSKKPKKAGAEPQVSIHQYIPAWVVSLIALVSAYIAFSLAIDSGSLLHYALGFYFFYTTVHNAKAAYKTFRKNNDSGHSSPKAKPARRASKANRAK